jgi:hypothetical protein
MKIVSLSDNNFDTVTVEDVTVADITLRYINAVL